MRTGDPTEAIHTDHSGMLAPEENVSTNASVAVLPALNGGVFLDPSTDYSWRKPSDMRRVPVNVGEYLDANNEYSSSSTNGAGYIGQTSIGLGKYLSADTKSRELAITFDGDSENTGSSVGRYFDPDEEASEVSGVGQSDQRDGGPSLEADLLCGTKAC
jgi:hypothetical protein